MKKNPAFFILVLFFCLNIFAWLAVYDLSRPKLLEVIFFDIGQGDSTFIETPEKNQILVDGGPDSTILEKLDRVLPFWDRTIDLIILTHPEKDHMAGLIEVLKRYKVNNILWTGVVRETAEYDEWADLIKKEGAEVIITRAGQKIILGSSQMVILYPFEDLAGELFKDSNETSIVVKLQYGLNSFLFTGDIGKESENKLIAESSDIDSDILKVGHHGSKYSSIDEFIREVSPKFALIGVGRENSYGHPASEVLDRLQKYGIKIFRTDLLGDVKIISDGMNLKINQN